MLLLRPIRLALRCSMLLSLAVVSVSCGNWEDVPTSQCASGRKWVGGEHSSGAMLPGRDCTECHQFAIAGTVYSKAGLNDPDDCAGIEGVSVLVEDANGKTFSLETNEGGNFYLSSDAGPLAFPLRSSVEADGEIREMQPVGNTGNCARCHTQSGANDAPGRIVAP